jgi:hypothetical protein
MSRNVSSEKTLASYEPFTAFTLAGNTNSYLDNTHYQTIKTEARRRIMEKEPIKSILHD